MAKYQASPKAKVSGPVVVGTVDALGIYKDTGYKILADCGISDPKMDQLYPLQVLCDFFTQVETRFGPSTLSVMGKNVAQVTPVPPGVDSPEAVLSSMGEAYQLNHQDVPADEGWRYEKTGPTSARMVCNAPYPDDFCRGIIEGFVRRFKQTSGGAVRAEIDMTQPRRDNGGQSVTVLVRW
jgi:hypothetical protein